MRKKYWFQQKTYGYGVTPCSWEGWVVTLVLIIWILVGLYYLLPRDETALEGLVYVLLFILVTTVVFLKLTKSHTQGELKWRWGKKK